MVFTNIICRHVYCTGSRTVDANEIRLESLWGRSGVFWLKSEQKKNVCNSNVMIVCTFHANSLLASIQIL